MNVLTVSQVNTYIKALLDEIPQIKNVYISGEISNFKHYYNSGHMYFTLKDSKSQLKCVMFASDNYKLKFTPKDGMKVICFGQVGVYERDGLYQLYVRDMHSEGAGDLTIAFEQLKAKLEDEGLFDESVKKAIPKYPKKIGVATSKMGAAVEDIKNVISRRYPLCDIIIVPTVVQGDAAAADIVKSIMFLDEMGDIDTIIVGRGGGSIEDLWAFNTEIVARAVYNCHTPIISAVGHETDFTICDFVADLRAPTPSAAAELAVPDIRSLIINVNNLSISLEKALDYKIESAQNRLDNIKNNSILANKSKFIDNIQTQINDYQKLILKSFKHKVDMCENSVGSYAASLSALSPLNIISRGYNIATNENGIIKSVNDAKVNDNIVLTLKDGKLFATVNEVINNG
jgi:exodeoxyribonuclease VII large subunit